MVDRLLFEEALAALGFDPERLKHIVEAFKWQIVRRPEAHPKVPGTRHRVGVTPRHGEIPPLRLVYICDETSTDIEMLYVEEVDDSFDD